MTKIPSGMLHQPLRRRAAGVNSLDLAAGQPRITELEDRLNQLDFESIKLDLEKSAEIFQTVLSGLEHNPELITSETLSLASLALKAAVNSPQHADSLSYLDLADQQQVIEPIAKLDFQQSRLTKSDIKKSIERFDEIIKNRERSEIDDFEFISPYLDSSDYVTQLTLIQTLLQFVQQNATVNSVASNVANVTIANTATVLVPTLLRQMVSHAVELGLKGSTGTAQIALALTAAVCPQVLNAIGLVRDHYQGTATVISDSSRVLNTLIGIGAIAGASATGVLPSLAAPLASVVIYSMLNNAVEAFVTCQNQNIQNPSSDALVKAAVFNSLSSTALQIGLGEASDALTSEIKNTLSEKLAQLRLNVAGGIAENLIHEKIKAAVNHVEMELKVEGKIPTRDELIDRITTDLMVSIESGGNTTITTSILFPVIEKYIPTGLKGDVIKQAVTGVFLFIESLLAAGVQDGRGTVPQNTIDEATPLLARTDTIDAEEGDEDWVLVTSETSYGSVASTSQPPNPQDTSK